MKMKHLGTRPSAQNNHRPLNRPLAQAVPEFNVPLRQFYQAKEGVEIISTCTASECAWMTVQNMDCMITHLWTRRHHNDRCTRQNSSVNSVVFRKIHRDSTRGCWDHLHTVRSKVVRGGTEKHMEHIATNQ